MWGHAAVYGKLSEDLGGFRERIQRGAFSEVIKKSDARCLVNHNADKLLGRQGAGTLLLEDTVRGLHFYCDLPQSETAREVVEAVERRDMCECSFAFIAGKDEWKMARGPGQLDERILLDIEALYDVSCTTFGAYKDTSVFAAPGAA